MEIRQSAMQGRVPGIREGRTARINFERTINMNVKIITMSDVQAANVHWLWYPYIPYGKISLVQGDPGEGNYELLQ